MTPKSSSSHNNDMIIDSTQVGFQSSYKNPREKDSKENKSGGNGISPSNKDIISEAKKTKKPTRDEEENASILVKNLLRKKTVTLQSKNFKTSTNMLFFRYDAKDKDRPYDKTPMILSLGSNSTHTLGLNLHWCPVQLRLTFLNIILNMFKQKIKSNQRFLITYRSVKSILKTLRLTPIIKLYINSRISSKGIIIPPEMWLSAAKIRAETFTGGYNSETLYKMALQGKI